MLLECRPDLRTGAMEEDALVALADAQRRRDLRAVPAFDVAQDDHLLLARRQVADRARDQLERLARQQMLLRDGGPALRWARPMPGPLRMIAGEEPTSVDRRFG